MDSWANGSGSPWLDATPAKLNATAGRIHIVLCADMVFLEVSLSLIGSQSATQPRNMERDEVLPEAHLLHVPQG